MAPRALKRNVSLYRWARQGSRDRDQRPWLGFARFLLLMFFVVMLFLLGESMVRHHFFTGGAMDYHNHPTGP
jgi:hypothetical protein